LLVSVVGLGYVGLPTAALLASRGMPVLGVDIDPHVVEGVNNGRIHIEEPDLNAIVHVSVGKGMLYAATKPEPADVFMIAVPTPFHNGEPDISYVERAARMTALRQSRHSGVHLASRDYRVCMSPVGPDAAGSQISLQRLRWD
jgi:UDP-N-acetyl-D-mannosaminuronic acid dehydrogenase